MEGKMKPWTMMDIAVLRNQYPTADLAELERRLGRSRQAIQVQASKYGIKRQDQTPQKVRWTEQDLSILRCHFPTMMNEPLARLLHVSKRTLIRKARELGLEKAPDFFERNDRSIRELISIKNKKPNPGQFQKGHIGGQRFEPGHHLTPEQGSEEISQPQGNMGREENK